MRRLVPGLLILAVTACGKSELRRVEIDYARLDLARHGHRIERLGDTLYAFGGFARKVGAPARGKLQAFSFDLPDGPWESRGDMAGEHAFFGSGVLNGEVFAIGPTVERFDPAEDRWSEVPVTTALPKSHLASAPWKGRLHVLGGYPVEAAGHHAFDASTGRVEAVEPLPGFTPSDHFHILAALDGRLHAVGGLRQGGSQLSKAHHAFDGTIWRERAAPPVELWAKFAAVAVLGDTLYVFSEEGDVAYDARADRWRPVKPMPVRLAMPATVVLDGRIVVIGGSPLDDQPRAVQVYDPATDGWTVHRKAER